MADRGGGARGRRWEVNVTNEASVVVPPRGATTTSDTRTRRGHHIKYKNEKGHVSHGPSSNATYSQTAAPVGTLQADGPRARRGKTALWNDSQHRRQREQGALQEAESRAYPHGGVPVVEHCRAVTGCLRVTAVKQAEWKAGRGLN